MNFEWDKAKSTACFEQRGFDFAYAARAFLTLTESFTPTPGAAMVRNVMS
jgi:uncharacterized DUF497 family protein